MRSDIRLALPSKGRLQLATLDFLARCGLEIKQSVTRGYIGSVPALPGLTVLFQRPRDITTSVANGGVDFGITGYDVVCEANVADRTRVIHDALGFGRCRIAAAVPEAWNVVAMVGLAAHTRTLGRPLRVATVFPHLTAEFMRAHGVAPVELIEAEGSLEVVPEIGYADMIVDVVETGATLQQNRLRALDDGTILKTQACLVANAQSLRRADVMRTAVTLVEYIEAHLRAEDQYMIFANVRGESFEAVGRLVTTQTTLGGLQGPTVAPIYPNPSHANESRGNGWYSVSVVVGRGALTDAILQFRSIGGSGVVVTPITYIFEEQPDRVAQLRQLDPG